MDQYFPAVLMVIYFLIRVKFTLSSAKKIEQIFFNGNSFEKIKILAPEKIIDIRVNYSGDSIISNTESSIYRLKQLYRVWLRSNCLSVFSPNFELLYEGKEGYSTYKSTYQLGKECYLLEYPHCREIGQKPPKKKLHLTLEN